MSEDDPDRPVLPHDLPSEVALLAGVMIEPRRVDEIAGLVNSDDFFRDEHRLLFRALLAVVARGDPPDPIFLRAELGADFDELGGAYYVSQLLDGFPRGSDVAAYARRVRDLAVARRLVLHLRRQQVVLLDHPETARNGWPAAHDSGLREILAGLTDTTPDTFVDDVRLLARPTATDLVRGRIRARSFAELWGESGSGKTTVGVDLSCAVAAGRPWLGADVTVNGVVLYILAEGADSFGPRLAAWKRHADIPLDQTIGVHTHSGPVQLLNPVAVERFITLARPLCPSLIVIDTYARCLLGNENSTEDASAAVAAIDRMRDELNATVFLLHHATKSGDRERGSSVLRAAADTVLQLAAADDLLTLKCEKQRDSAPFPDLTLRLVPDGAACRVELAGTLTPTGPLSPTQARLLAELQHTFTAEGATAREWLAACPGMHERVFFRGKKALLSRSLVRRSGSRFVATSTCVTDTHLTGGPDRGLTED